VTALDTTRKETAGIQPNSVTTVALQRACSCGGHGADGRGCEECRRQHPPGLRRASLNTASPTRAPANVDPVLREPGQSLDQRTRRSLEGSFGRDFSHIRVHTSQGAAESARAIGAAAYTVGHHIVFGANRYAPSTVGRRLLSHELAHAVQQSAAAKSEPSAGHPLEIRDDPGEERGAEAAATAVVDARRVPPANAAAVSLQRAVPAAAATATGPVGAQPPVHGCIQSVSGEEIEALLQSRTVTVVDFWAEYCGPCKMLSADLADLCKRFRAKPPAAPIRFFSVDVQDPANKAISDRYAADSLPALLIFVGPTLERRIDSRPDFEVTQDAVETAIDHAARSGAHRGAVTGAKIGAAIGGIGGLLTGVGLALAGVLTGGLGLLGVLGLAAGGALAGGGLGAAIGAFAGWLSDKRDIRGNARRGAFEADVLIRQEFGTDIPRGMGPLNDAPVHAVSQADLRMLQKCRFEDDANADLVGWTDTGREGTKAVATAADEPFCANGQQLEHATKQRPVIYYAKDKPDATVLIHEGLHAYNHPHFSSQLRNNMTEAATEYFTRKIGSRIGASSSSAYGNWLEYVEALVKTIGEPALRAAYFRGDFQPANAVLGRCGLEAWAQRHLTYQQQSAAEILAKRGGDYCKDVIPYSE
jgi:thiol-disulfide isomerase/thioredoxin